MATTWKARLLVVVLLIVVIFGGATPLGTIQSADSCYTQYEKFTADSWNELEACIRDTNGASWGDRLVIRSGCNARWVSNTFEAAARYSSCMAFQEFTKSRG
jgi:hypothetical protein